MPEDSALIPVIIGIGEINDRPKEPSEGLDSVQLMAAAARLADAEAGGLLARCDWLGIVPQISFPDLKPEALLPGLLKISPKHIELSELASGDTPIRHLNEAANAIGRGEATVALIVGGEAVRTGASRPAAPGTGGGMAAAAARRASPLRRRYGLVTPTDIYPLYENAARAAWGQSLAEGQTETGVIWSLMSEVAAQADGAWIRKPESAETIATTTAANRMIAFPYTKLMVANSAVNQGAAFIVTSQAIAREAGLEKQAIFVGAGAAAHEAEDPLERARWDAAPSMAVSLTEALAANGLSGKDLDFVELYSCFPCVPKLARRVIGWPEDRPATVHGGLTFGGGPVGNYMTHATAGMVRKLRQSGEHGLLFGNGGYCTHNHVILLSKSAPEKNPFPQDFHRQELADAARGEISVLRDDVAGVATIETYTVVYGRDGAPTYGVVLCRNAAGDRLVAKVEAEDAATIALLTDGKREPVGVTGKTELRDEILYWREG